ncbi:MAG TPA: glycine zipper 2TM domain-containing protein [Sphingobium sp.]
MLHFGKKALIALSLGAMTLTGTMVSAQPGQDWNRRDDRGRRDDRRDDRGRHDGWDKGDNRGKGDNWAKGDNWRSKDRNWRNWRNYDYNRYERGGGGYYAENYYRGGYRPVRVDRNTRIYRGNNGNYYCRRNDGTTGLIVGAALGGVIGNQLDRGGSNLLGTLLGAGAGGLLGREVDRGGVSCR